MPYILLTAVMGVLFYKTLLLGKIPFPADLLLSEYVPFRHQSYFGYVPGTIPSKGQYFDVVRELYPWKTLVIDAVKNGHLPLWNPYNFSGTPLLANYQSQALYPLGILYFLLPQIAAWTILVMAQPLLGSFFMFLFSRQIGISVAGSLVASILFNYSGFANVWMEFNTVWHTVLWLPLLLYIFEKGIKYKTLSARQIILFIFALFSSITAGHPQDFINVFLFFLIYAFVRLLSNIEMSNKEKRSFVLSQLLIPIVIPFLLAAPQIFPTINLYQTSSRVFHDLKNIVSCMLIQWWQMPMMIYQDFFGNPTTKTYMIPDTYVGKTISIGIVGLMLALWSFTRKVKSWYWFFFVCVSVIVLILTVRTPLSEILYAIPIPLLSTGTPTRNLFILLFSLSVLAGFGFDSLRQIKNKKPVIIVYIGIIGISILAYTGLPHVISEIANSQSVMKKSIFIISCLSTITTLCVLMQIKFPKLRYLLLLFIIAELGYGFWKFNSFVPSSYVYPPHELLSYLSKNAGVFRYWGYGSARMESNINAQYKLYSPDGTDPLNLSLYNRFIQSSNDGVLPQGFNLNSRSDVNLAPGWGKIDLPNNPYRLRIMDLLGVKYVLDRIDNPKNPETFPSNHFIPLTSTTDGYTVFENTDVLPRAFLADEIMFYSNDKDFEQKFFNPNFDIRNTVLLPEGVTTFQPKKGNDKKVSIKHYEDTEVVIKTSSDTKQFLFLSDAYDLDWKVTLDGKKTNLIQANYAFRGVEVPEGPHEIRFTYFPDSFRNGLIISTTGLIIAVFYLFFLAKRKKE